MATPAWLVDYNSSERKQDDIRKAINIMMDFGYPILTEEDKAKMHEEFNKECNSPRSIEIKQRKYVTMILNGKIKPKFGPLYLRENRKIKHTKPKERKKRVVVKNKTNLGAPKKKELVPLDYYTKDTDSSRLQLSKKNQQVVDFLQEHGDFSVVWKNMFLKQDRYTPKELNYFFTHNLDTIATYLGLNTWKDYLEAIKQYEKGV